MIRSISWILFQWLTFQHCIDVFCFHVQGYTPLHAAASMGQTAVVADLLEADANVSMNSFSGMRGGVSQFQEGDAY